MLKLAFILKLCLYEYLCASPQSWPASHVPWPSHQVLYAGHLPCPLHRGGSACGVTHSSGSATGQASTAFPLKSCSINSIHQQHTAHWASGFSSKGPKITLAVQVWSRWRLPCRQRSCAVGEYQQHCPVLSWDLMWALMLEAANESAVALFGKMSSIAGRLMAAQVSRCASASAWGREGLCCSALLNLCRGWSPRGPF